MELLIAPPGGGKTEYCLKEIVRCRREMPLANIFVIVPDELQAAFWKKRLARQTRGGFIGAKVFRFGSLARYLLERGGASAVPIPDSLNRDLIRRALSLAPLRTLTPIADRNGLVTELEKTFRELQHECKTAADLAQVDTPYFRDVTEIFRVYRDLLRERNWLSPALVIQEAAACADVCTGCPLLVIDGFDSFAEDELRLIRALKNRIPRILLTLPGRSEFPALTERKFERTYQTILSALEPEKIHFLEPYLSAFAPLSADVFTPNEHHELIPDNQLIMIQGSSQADEVRETLRELKLVLIDPAKAIRPGECAVFVPNFEPYQAYLEQIGKEFSIPLHFARQKPLGQEPAIAVLKSLLVQSATQFPSDTLLPLLRSPFLRHALAYDDEAEHSQAVWKLECLDRAHDGIIGRAEWMRAIGENIQFAEDDQQSAWQELAARLEALMDALTPPDGVSSRREWAGWIDRLTERLNFWEYVRPEVIASRDALQCRLIFCEEKLEKPALDFSAFLAELNAETENCAVEDRNSGFDSVFVGDIFKAQGARFKLVVLMGFAEGLFPKQTGEELLLNDEVRAVLGIPRTFDQSSLLIQALIRANRVLLISRPLKTDDGTEWEPSVYWDAVSKFRGPLPKHETRLEPASESELLFWAARYGLELPSEDETRRAKFETAEKMLTRSRELRDGIYDGGTLPPGDAESMFNCGAIEAYLKCPFFYFLSRMLRLEVPPEPNQGVTALKLGRINHQILEKTFKTVPDLRDTDGIRAAAERSTEEVLAVTDVPGAYGSEAEQEYQKTLIRENILKTIDAMQKTGLIGMSENWCCCDTERKFEYLTIPLDEGTLRIRGRIDRVDTDDAGHARVIDYKRTFFRLSKEIIAQGLRVQADVYAVAAVKVLKRGDSCESCYWVINKGEKIPAESYSSEKREIPRKDSLEKFYLGIRDANFTAVGKDNSCAYCPGADFCRQFVKKEHYA